MGAPIKVLKPLKVENYDLPVNIFLINCYAGVGKNPLFWDNAEEFNPERYKEKSATMGIWMPFGTGPRACIGKHMALLDSRLAVARILQKYRI
jgi:cytochrome P450